MYFSKFLEKKSRKESGKERIFQVLSFWKRNREKKLIKKEEKQNMYFSKFLEKKSREEVYRKREKPKHVFF